MVRRPTKPTRTYTLFPYPPPFRSAHRTAVVDADQDRPSGVERGHLDIAWQRQRLVRRADARWIDGFAVRGRLSGEIIAIPARIADLVIVGDVDGCVSHSADFVRIADHYRHIGHARSSEERRIGNECGHTCITRW